MYPSRFRYEAPRSLEEAIALLHDGGGDAKVLAGGQSLVPLMKLRFASPGADRRHQQPARPGLPPGRPGRHAAHRRAVPARRSRALGPARSSQPTMAAAAPLIADPIVRNRGTLVGSLCHADPQGDWASVVTAPGDSIITTAAAHDAITKLVAGPLV